MLSATAMAMAFIFILAQLLVLMGHYPPQAKMVVIVDQLLMVDACRR